MKTVMIIALLPIIAHCYQAKSDLFCLSERGDECLCHIDSEPEIEESMTSDHSLSLLEIDENDESLIPWSSDNLASDDLSTFLKADGEIDGDVEDIFAYETPCCGEEDQLMPSYEKVAENRRRLFHRPRVVETRKPNSVSSTIDIGE